MAHTPGPYFVVTHPEGWTIQDRVTGVGRCIAAQYGDSSRANADLLASSPDLLAALEAQEKADVGLETFSITGEEWVNLMVAARVMRQAAIAKAKGVGTPSGDESR